MFEHQRVVREGQGKKLITRRELNPRPSAHRSEALTTELVANEVVSTGSMFASSTTLESPQLKSLFQFAIKFSNKKATSNN